MKIAVSACLLGDKVRYNCTSKTNKELTELLKGHEVIKICPELYSGLTPPHQPLEILNDKVLSKDNVDYTKMLTDGCNKLFESVKDCDLFILKSKSPSCGYKYIYDGTFTDNLIQGNGIFTSICLNNNLKVFSELDIQEIKNILGE